MLVSFAIIAWSICSVSSRRRSRSLGQMRNQATAPSPSSEPPLTAYNTRIHQHTAITSPTGITLTPSPLASSQPPAFLRSTSVPIHNRSRLPRRTAFNRSPLQPRLETRSPSPQPINPRSPLPRLRGTLHPQVKPLALKCQYDHHYLACVVHFNMMKLNLQKLQSNLLQLQNTNLLLHILAQSALLQATEIYLTCSSTHEDIQTPNLTL